MFMPIMFPCECGRKLRVRADLAGKRVKCPACGTTLAVPQAVAEAKLNGACRLSVERAEAIVRWLAPKHRAHKTLKNLGHLDPNHVANARAAFAKEMSDQETPLVLLDRSPKGDGSAGCLITNEKAYSSFFAKPIRLGEVLVAGVERPSQLQELFNKEAMENTLVVNGVAISHGTEKFQFLAELMTELGKELRREHGLVWNANDSDQPTEHRLERVCAALACAGRPEAEIVDELSRAGLGDRAKAMVRQMNALRTRPRRLVPVLLIAAAFPLLALAIFFAWASLSGGVGKARDDVEAAIYVPLVLAVLGIGFPMIGLYRLCSGVTPWRTEELLRAWEKREACSENTGRC
jgi:mannitol/fructose-specific phosphotransferase system IIA component